MKIHIEFSRREGVLGLAGLLLIGGAVAAMSDTMTLTTYFPSPAGIYQKLISVGDTFLARDGGKVGVGTTAPKAVLEVNGDLRVGGTTASCAAQNEGDMRYNLTTKKMEFCNATAWTNIGTADFGAPVPLPVPLGAVFAVPKSGILTAFTNSTCSGTGCWAGISCYAGSNPLILTLVASGSVGYDGGPWGLTCPVKAGSYAKITGTGPLAAPQIVLTPFQ
ncbi:MAG TPA: hypothetical protein VNI01_14725 [Elusimicrobiota bacterium]|jgi:hypothetical protein|nr:hypothetical protein [Elusimicrobiota bacterium]